MTTIENEVKESIRGILANLEKVTKWVTCPSCLEEWTRLRACSFFSDLDGTLKKVTDSACVECSEVFKNPMYWINKYPLIPPMGNWPMVPDVEKKWAKPYKHEDVIIWSNLSLFIIYPPVSKVWRLDTRGSGTGISMKENDSIITRHETFPETWSYIKKRINDSVGENEKKERLKFSKL